MHLHPLSSLSIDPVWLIMIDLTSESITLSLSLSPSHCTVGHLSVVRFLLHWVVLPAFSRASSPALPSIRPFNSHLFAPHLIMPDRHALAPSEIDAGPVNQLILYEVNDAEREPGFSGTAIHSL